MSTPTLPLQNIVDVTVQVQPNAVAPPAFNQALIIGTSSAIPSYGVGGRAVQFAGGTTILSQMLAYGFSNTSSEYLAATQFLAASITPYYLWIGRQDLTAIGVFVIDAAGTNYVVGDVVGVTQAGAGYGFLKVVSVSAGGVVTALQFVQQGTGYSVATGLATTGGTGTGLTISISSIGETCLQAAVACRAIAPQWYLFTALAAVDSDNIALSEWAQTASPVCQVFWQTNSSNALTGIGDIFTTLNAGKYNRYQGVYSTTQSGAAPNNAYISSALMGLAMGLNTGFNNSYFTLTNKNLVGMTTEPISENQFLILSGNNGNVYGSFGGSFKSYSTGITGSGQYFDNILGIDMLTADLQFAGANVLAQYNAIPQNDAGQAVAIHAMNVDGCQPSVNRGFLSPGVWNGNTIQFGTAPNQTVALQAGMSLANGFLNVSPSYSQIPKPAKRASAPIYCAVIQTDAIQQLIIAVMVQQ